MKHGRAWSGKARPGLAGLDWVRQDRGVADAPAITDPLWCQNHDGVLCEEAFGQTVVRWCENCQRRRMRDRGASTAVSAPETAGAPKSP